MNKSIADLIELIISDWKKFLAFTGLISALVGLALLIVWLVPVLLHVKTSALTLSPKGSEIEFKSSTADMDQYYLVISPQTSWQPTHIYVKRGSKIGIIADGRVNIDSFGLNTVIQSRIGLEKEMQDSHKGLSQDPKHTPEEYFSEKDWQKLVPRHYWNDPEGDSVIADSSFAGRQKYKIAPGLPFGALLGTIMARDDVDSNGQPPPVEKGDIFLVGRRWPRRTKEEFAPATGFLWFAINNVVEPQEAFPNAKGLRLSDVFLLDNLGFYRAVVTVSH